MFKFIHKCFTNKFIHKTIGTNYRFSKITTIPFCQKIIPQQEAEEMELRPIQLKPKYEAAISTFISGDIPKGLNFLEDLKNDLKSEHKECTDDYIFLLKKIISFQRHNSVDKKLTNSLLYELHEVGIKLYKTDFTNLFDNIEYIILQLIHIDPPSAIEYIDSILAEEVLPQFFNNIIYYYQATALGIEGKPKGLEKGIELFEKIINQLDDKYINGCLMSNYATLFWWSKLSKHMDEMRLNGNSLELIKLIAKDSYSIVKTYKEAIIQIENLDLAYEEDLKVEEESPRERILSRFLNKQFDVTDKYDKQIINEMVYRVDYI
jgi:hypothetical protein